MGRFQRPKTPGRIRATSGARRHGARRREEHDLAGLDQNAVPSRRCAPFHRYPPEGITPAIEPPSWTSWLGAVDPHLEWAVLHRPRAGWGLRTLASPRRRSADEDAPYPNVASIEARDSLDQALERQHRASLSTRLTVAEYGIRPDPHRTGRYGRVATPELGREGAHHFKPPASPGRGLVDERVRNLRHRHDRNADIHEEIHQDEGEPYLAVASTSCLRRAVLLGAVEAATRANGSEQDSSRDAPFVNRCDGCLDRPSVVLVRASLVPPRLRPHLGGRPRGMRNAQQGRDQLDRGRAPGSPRRPDHSHPQ